MNTGKYTGLQYCSFIECENSDLSEMNPDLVIQSCLKCCFCIFSVVTGGAQGGLDAKKQDDPDPSGRVDSGWIWKHER